MNLTVKKPFQACKIRRVSRKLVDCGATPERVAISEDSPYTITQKIHFSTASKGRREIVPGPTVIKDTPDGRVPRVSRLMALALKFDAMITDGLICDQAEVAELGHVSRSRVTQIMNLNYLAPDIQEEILFLPLIASGKDTITETHLRSIVCEIDWEMQRRHWSFFKERRLLL